jgi:hypothetical protein
MILDLDETIIHCVSDPPAPGSNIVSFEIMASGFKSVILLRPNYFEFLRFLLEQFSEIYVYTAGTHEYATAVVSEIFGTEILTNMWSRAHCEDDIIQGRTYKPLFNKFSHENVCIDDTRTFIIDDRDDVSARNFNAKNDPARGLNNHYIIPQFRGDENDDELLKVMTRILEWKREFAT